MNHHKGADGHSLRDMQTNKIQIPLVKTDIGGFLVTLDLNLYSKEAIIATTYKYTDRFYIFMQEPSLGDNILNITFEAKNQTLDEIAVKQFCNDIIDQQYREIVTKKFGYIRDLVVEQAFKPISKTEE